MAPILVLGACQRRPDTTEVVVSAIGGEPALVDASRGVLDTPARLFADATAQGLVRFDATGQIEPGLAERWTVIDDGTSYIFRLRDGAWADDGTPVTAEQVVAALKRQLRPASRNPLAPFLTAIDEIVVMTPQVIEVRLSRPRPDLLKLFAQPELAILRPGRPAGSGPFRIAGAGAAPLLRPVIDPSADDGAANGPRPQEDVRLIGERAARAVARFAARRSDLVAGGTFVDWPLVAIARIAPANMRADPAAGLLGLAVVDRSDFLADAANRLAVAQAFDRAALAVVMGWEAADRLLPEPLDSTSPPAVPAWTLLTPAQRIEGARNQVARSPDPVRLRLALPSGPGATLLWGQLAATLLRIGIVPERVALDAPADLRLVDAVAPYDSARWYLATACDPCDAHAQTALEAARVAPTAAMRGQAIALADRALDADVAFIPLARPFRWSLAARRLAQFTPNARAWHPLNRLRRDTR